MKQEISCIYHSTTQAKFFIMGGERDMTLLQYSEQGRPFRVFLCVTWAPPQGLKHIP